MKQNSKTGFLLLLLLQGLLPALWAQQDIPARDLVQWNKWGEGTCIELQDGVLMQEGETSKGLMLVSPANFPDAFVLRFSMVALTSSTVMVTVLQAADTGNAHTLTIPGNYDGSMGIWNTEKRSYFVAFRNAPHGATPYIGKQPGLGMVKAPVPDDLLPGKKMMVEVGVQSNRVWLKVDGKVLVDSPEKKTYPGGRFAFRIRGLPGLPAACLLRELSFQRL